MGYIGLPTAAILATNGYEVTGVDTDSEVVQTLNDGDLHIQEPGLKTLARAAFKSGNLQAKREPEEADVFIIAVPTPLEAESPDLQYIQNASKSVAEYLKENDLVILESTSPPGTTREEVKPILEQGGIKAGKDFYLAHSPERVLPGSILQEMTQNDRVIGGIDRESAEKAKEIYKSFSEGDIYLTDATTAELVKVMENTFRDVNIALSNELSNICREVGADVWEAIELANKHPRVNYHRPGPGVGGHCIPIDPWFIAEKSENNSELIRLSRKLNEEQKEVVIDRTEKIVEEVTEPKVTILGVAYKGNVDDPRESPAIDIVEGLKDRNLNVEIYDPHVSSFPYELAGFETAFEKSDCAVLITDHDEFKYLSPEDVGSLMNKRQIFDTRNCVKQDKWEKAGFKVRLLGSG